MPPGGETIEPRGCTARQNGKQASCQCLEKAKFKNIEPPAGGFFITATWSASTGHHLIKRLDIFYLDTQLMAT